MNHIDHEGHEASAPQVTACVKTANGRTLSKAEGRSASKIDGEPSRRVFIPTWKNATIFLSFDAI